MANEKQLKNSKLRHLEYYGMQGALDHLYADSVKGKVFTGLMSLIASEDNIRLAYRNIKRNHGSNTEGVDGMTIRDIEKMPEEEVIRIVQAKLQWYKPSMVRRVEIPKPDGRTRPLGIPAMWDRLIQQCILQVLEPICEAKFHDRSNGFRPNRSAEHAIAQCYYMMQQVGLHFVVDIDIKGFFDNVNHAKLVRQLWAMGIRDKKLICIIKEMLKAPIALPNGSICYPDKGTPQGGILSPLLSNIVLNELDWWVASQWEKMPAHQVKDLINLNGSAVRSHAYRAFRNSKLKEMHIVRYADDFKIFCRNRSDAERIFAAVKQWLHERLKLEVSDEKSKICNLKKYYSEFLGFKFKVVRKRDIFAVRSHMCDKAIRRTAENLKEQIKKIARPKDLNDERLMIHQYNAMVRGVHEYFEIATKASKDFSQIIQSVYVTMFNRLGKRLKRHGSFEKKYADIQERYGASKQIRFVSGRPIAPAGYVRARNPMFKRRSVNKYTSEGRVSIHKPLGMDITMLELLRREKSYGRSIEFMDNRVSRYCGQYGKCAITGKPLEIGEMHCHHVTPKEHGGTDAYNNLLWLHMKVHRLIHATDNETIRRYLQALNLSQGEIQKLNRFRARVFNEKIPANV